MSSVKSKQRTRVPVDVQPKDLSARFDDQKWQCYAKQGLAAEGYDPEALSPDFTADNSDDPHLRAIIEQLSADYDSIEQKVTDAEARVKAALDGAGPTHPVSPGTEPAGTGSSGRAVGRESGNILRAMINKSTDNTSFSSGTAIDLMESVFSCEDTDPDLQNSCTNDVMSASEFIVDAEKRNKYFAQLNRRLETLVNEKKGVDLRKGLMDYGTRVLGAQKMSAQMLVQVTAILLNSDKVTSTVKGHSLEYWEQLLRMTALQCDRFWSNRGKDGRQQGLINKSQFPQSPRLGISLMIGSTGAMHCSKAWMGLVEYLCGDDETNPQVLEKKSLWGILSAAENPGFDLQQDGCQHPLAQLVLPDGTLETSVDWSMREQAVRNSFNHAAELSGDATVKPITDDIDIINNMRMAMDNKYLAVMDGMFLREEIDFQKLTWSETYDYMLKVDTWQKLQYRIRLERESRMNVLGGTRRSRTPKVSHSTWVQQQQHKAATAKQKVRWQSRGKPADTDDQTHLTDEQRLIKCTKCDSLGHSATDCDPTKVRCRICKALGHSSQKCDKLSDRKCLNFFKNGTCEYGMRCRFILPMT